MRYLLNLFIWRGCLSVGETCSRCEKGEEK